MPYISPNQQTISMNRWINWPSQSQAEGTTKGAPSPRDLSHKADLVCALTREGIASADRKKKPEGKDQGTDMLFVRRFGQGLFVTFYASNSTIIYAHVTWRKTLASINRIWTRDLLRGWWEAYEHNHMGVGCLSSSSDSDQACQGLEITIANWGLQPIPSSLVRRIVDTHRRSTWTGVSELSVLSSRELEKCSAYLWSIVAWTVKLRTLEEIWGNEGGEEGEDI